MSSFKNSKKASFLNKIPEVSLEDPTITLANRCSFNFSYFDSSQPAGQNFSDWTESQLNKLLNKLVEYTKETLQYWMNQKVGSGKHRLNILEEYGSFPKNSDFEHPKHIPHQVSWTRFRLEQKVRLIGFMIPSEFDGKAINSKGFEYNRNTFYVVFLDKDHRFYKTEKQ